MKKNPEELWYIRTSAQCPKCREIIAATILPRSLRGSIHWFFCHCQKIYCFETPEAEQKARQEVETELWRLRKVFIERRKEILEQQKRK